MHFANQESLVWGSGMIARRKLFKAPPKRIHSVRGKLTRRILEKNGVKCPDVYGDVSMLYRNFYSPNIKTQEKIGIIPHYVDQTNPLLSTLAKIDNVRILDINTETNVFIDDVLACSKVLSSSLHGLIVCDMYGVPNRRVRFSDKIIGKNFKYFDYFSSVKRRYERAKSITSKGSFRRACRGRFNDRIDIDLDLLLNTCPFLR